MKPIEKHNQRIKRLWPITSNFLSIPFQIVIKKKRFCSLLMTFMGLLLLAGTFNLMSPAVANASISVTVTGDGVANPMTFTQADLEAMTPVKACLYSTINTWPTKKWYVAEGPKLVELLKKAGIKDDAKLIKFTSTDGFTKTITWEQLAAPRYYYPGLKENHEHFGYIPGSPDEPVPVETILALKSVEDSNDPSKMNDQNAPLLVMGQRWITEQNNELFVKHVAKIEVSTVSPQKWETPVAIPVGGTVPVGTGVVLSTSDMDGDNIHYTLDGSEPTIESPMYNWVKKRWWGQRTDDLAEIIQPIEIIRDTTIKAIAIGSGKEDSDIVTFNYQVTLAPAPTLTANKIDNALGRSIEITFTDDAAWREAITEVSVDGVALNAGQYSKDTAGKIIINGDVFNTGKEYNIVIKADGYVDAGVMQKILAPVTLTTPAGGEQFTKGQQVTIKGTVEDTLLNLNVKVIGPDGQTVYGPKDVEVVDGKFETAFTLSSSAEIGIYTIILNGVNLSGTVTGTFAVKSGSSGEVEPDGDVVLTITGSGVTNEVKLTQNQLKGMKQYQQVYSAVNTWPTKKWCVGKGVKLRDLLDLAGMRANYGLIKFTAVDGFTVTLTVKELLNDTRYYFPNFKSGADGDGHVPGSSAGAQMVEPLVALVSVEGTDNPAYMSDLNTLLLIFGQRAVTEQTGQLFVKKLNKIEVIAAGPSQWDTPKADPDSGEVPVGTLVKLSNANMDDDKIHYTTDGSTPTINSPMYNWIASRWWSSRADVLETINHPIEIKENTIIKAITIGPGKNASKVATFTYKIKSSTSDTIEKISPGKDNTITLGDEVTLEIPANALKETGDVAIKIEKVAAPPAIPAGYKLVSSVYEFSVDGNKKYSFAKNVTLTLRFDPAAIGEDEIPAIHYYDEALSEWVNIDGTVDGDTITIEVDHFAKFTVMVEEKMIEAKEEISELSDINDHWAQKNIEQLVACGAVGGYPDGTFKPDNTITRAEFVTIVVKAFKLENQSGKTFADTASHWAGDYITCAVASGIVTGYDVDTFGPDDLVTREQMAVMISKAAKPPMAAEEFQFIDSDSISGWARSAIAAATLNGIMKGYPDNTIQPQGNATRAEAVTVIINALNKLEPVEKVAS